MHKFLFITLCTMFCLFFSLPVNAQEISRKIGDGYTADGIHYSIYEAESSPTLTCSIDTSIDVSRDFVYDEYTVPPRQVEHHERINGSLYVGTLRLYSFKTVNNKYIANYRGTLYRTTTY